MLFDEPRQQTPEAGIGTHLAIFGVGKHKLAADVVLHAVRPPFFQHAGYDIGHDDCPHAFWRFGLSYNDKDPNALWRMNDPIKLYCENKNTENNFAYPIRKLDEPFVPTDKILEKGFEIFKKEGGYPDDESAKKALRELYPQFDFDDDSKI